MAQNRPLYKEFVNIQSRLETFKKFPVSFKKIKTEALACAGFFFLANEHTYQSDQCICYSCGLKLYKWEPRDDPWDEHKKYNKSCEYILRHYAEKPNVQQLQDLYPSNLKSPLPYSEIYGKQAAPPRQQGIMSHKDVRAPSIAYSPNNNKYIPKKYIPTIHKQNGLSSSSSQYPHDKAHTFPQTNLVSEISNTSFQKNYQESSKHPFNITPSLQPSGYPTHSEMSTRNLAAMPESNKPEYNTQELIIHQREKTQNSFIYVSSPQLGLYPNRDKGYVYPPNMNIPAQSEVPVSKLHSKKQSEIQPNASNFPPQMNGELPSSLKPFPGPPPMPLSAHVENQIQDLRIPISQVRPGTYSRVTPPYTGIYSPRPEGNQWTLPSQLRYGNAPAVYGNTYTQPQPAYTLQQPTLRPQYYTSGHRLYQDDRTLGASRDQSIP